MKFYLRYCCAMCFALISFLLAPPLSAQAQTREAYVAQSADKTTLTFYYDALRATRTGKSWGIKETKTAWAGTFEVAESTTTRVVFDASFRDFRPTTTALWFYNCRALKQIEGLEYLNTSEVKDMGGMFDGCSVLPSLDLSHFNTQKVTHMGGMFDGCSGLTSLNLSHFNTQNVTNMFRMFSFCSGLTSLDLSHFNTQNVTNMGGMFWGCSGLPSLDLKNFNTQKVTNMGGMFWNCSGLTSLDLSHFNTQKVTNMVRMFKGCPALTTINSNTAWQCPGSTDMFTDCTQLKGAVAYDENKTDVKMANPETGYFTRSNDGGVKAYVAQSADKTTLTFYYDNQRATRTGTTWGIEETEKVVGVDFPAWAGTYRVADSTTTRVVFDASFRDFRPTTTAMWFYRCEALKQIEGLEYLNTQNVTDMNRMFWFCSGLTSLDLSHFNTQNVTDMSRMFSGCSALATISSNTAWQCPQSEEMFAGCTQLKGAVAYDENKTDVTMANPETGYFTRSNDGGVEAYVAQSADKTTLIFYYDDQRATRTGTTWGIEETKEEEDATFPAWAGTWNVADRVTARVVFDASFRDFRPTTTAQWFTHCKVLTQIEGLEHFNTSEVKDMSGMFEYCSGLTSLDLSHFNTQNVTDMQSMFFGCSGLTSLDVKNFNTQNVTNMQSMFFGCSGLASLDVKNFDTQKVTNMGSMFSGCSGLTSLDVSHFNTQNVTDMSAMFSGCSGLTSLDLKNFNTQNVRVMWAMFSGCSGLTSLDLQNFDTQNVTSMNLMFYGCSGLTSLDVQNFNTQNVTGMNHMFFDCSGLTSLDLQNFNTQNVTSMDGMFSGCSGLTSLDLKNFDTQNVTDMAAMFSGCSGLTSLDVQNFDTQNVTDMAVMFSGCSALTTIKSNTAWQCPQSVYMFTGCAQLKGAVAYDENKTDVKMANPETGYFTAKPTAVESVRFGADSVQHIYTLQGKRVRGEWTHLPAGVYVVNGKKTVKP